MVDATAGHELLSFMDAFSGYNQILMHPEDQEKTSFVTERGIFCYKVMPFGLKNAGATYQRLVNKMFSNYLGKTMEVYIDDMLVKSLSAEQHLDHLRQAFEFLGYMVTQRGIEANPEQIRSVLDIPSPTHAKDVQCLAGRIAALNRFISKSSERCHLFFSALRKSKDFEWTPACEEALQELKRYLTSPPLLSKPKDGEPLSIYLAVSDTAVSSVLIREEDGKQLPVYYVSKSLLDAETRYSQLEKLALALVSAARKLRPYFQCHPIVVVTTYPLKGILQKPELSGRLIKWAVELSEYDISYQPRTAIKSQALADFIANFAPSAQAQANSELLTIATPPYSSWTLSVDGSSNMSGAGLGLVLISPEGDIIQQAIKCGFKATNNEAEYEALIFNITQVPRLENTHADSLANLGSSVPATTSQTIPLVYLQWPVAWEKPPAEVVTVDSSGSWMTPILQYLAHDELPIDKNEARHLRAKAARFTILDGQLLRRSFSGPYLKLKNFIWKNVICRFGVPKEIVTDNGSQFISHEFQDFCREWGIKLNYSTPRYPQANGQAESSNKTIINTLKRRLRKAKGAWADELPGVLWSYRTTARTPTGETPFALAYGSEAVIPVETGIQSLRYQWLDEDTNWQQLNHNLDSIDELRDMASLRTAAYHQQVAR
ncbi:hypothetical protein UlMin_031813 [Ulmus minor]